MNSRSLPGPGFHVSALLVAALIVPAQAGERKFTLASAVPDDVFLFVNGCHNPEREFLDRYWSDVLDAFGESGIGDDAWQLVGSFLDEDGQAEAERLKERAAELLAGVQWKQLVGKEVAFARRLSTPRDPSAAGVLMAFPEMVFLSRTDNAKENYEGLVALLQGVVDEINGHLSEERRLDITRARRTGADVAELKLVKDMDPAPTIFAALRSDLLIVGMGREMMDDTLTLLEGAGAKPSLADDARFRAAFASLPPAEDTLMYFDMQALLRPITSIASTLVSAIGGPHDVFENDRINDQANALNAKAIDAYRNGDFKAALDLVKQAHDVEPNDSIILYNLACFSALNGKKTEALDWLEKSVETGFYAPDKIATDSDLASVRDQARFKAARDRAAELASSHSADDIIVHSTKSGEAHDLTSRAWKVYEEGHYAEGLDLVQQAQKIAPDDSRVLYYLACFHALNGNPDQALDFLQRAADGGFYCPQHISNDPDLMTVRKDQRYQKALATARRHAAQATRERSENESKLWLYLVDRIANAVGILDNVASVEFTDGYSVRTETRVALVAGAKDRPIYPVFARRGPGNDFDRYLPQETQSFSVGTGLDIDALYRFVEESIAGAGPQGVELLDKWAGIQKENGFNLRRDLFDWIDGGYVHATLDGGGSVLMIKVSDESAAKSKVDGLVEFLSTKLPDLATQLKQPMLAMLAVRATPSEHERLQGFQNLYVGMSPQPITWGVADGYLVFGAPDDAVAKCMDTAAGKHAGIRQNARVMEEAIVADGPFVSVSLSDQRNLGQELATGIGMVSMVTGMATMAIPDEKARTAVSKVTAMLGKLAPVVAKIDFFKSTATRTTFDGAAWHVKMVTHYVDPKERVTKESP